MNLRNVVNIHSSAPDNKAQNEHPAHLDGKLNTLPEIINDVGSDEILEDGMRLNGRKASLQNTGI